MPSLQEIFKGLPTANQEALQAPSVDPIITATNAGVFGFAPALKGLLSQIILNATGGWAGKGQLGQYQMPQKAETDMVDRMYLYGIDRLMEDAMRTGKSTGDFETLANNLLVSLDPQKHWLPTIKAAGKGFGKIFGKIPYEVFEEP